MPDLGGGLLGCFRCCYVWRPRKSPVRVCPRCKSPAWNTPRASPRFPPKRKRGVGIEEVIGPKRGALKALAAEYDAVDIRVFGSLARHEGRARSDIDLLVRFRRPVGLLRRIELKERVEALLGRTVDLATEANLHWLIKPQVLQEAVSL